MTLTVPINADDHVLGRLDARVTLVEYGDYECPYCGEAYPMVKELLVRLGDEVRFVFRNMPLSQMHPHALLAAYAAEAAAGQHKYWPMHDALYENQQHLSEALVIELASGLGLDSEKFVADVRSRRIHEHVQHDFMSGVRSGVAGTPTFFIDNDRYDGAPDLDELTRALRDRIELQLRHSLRLRRRTPR